MGPSGCGKTTLLNVLARRPISATNVECKVGVNGVEVSDAAFRHTTLFVEDHDNFIGSLTVRETLEFAFRLTGAV
jgi:ABC-type multidrug transport system ATPase subunit